MQNVEWAQKMPFCFVCSTIKSMKHRDYKQFVSGQYYHLFNRGNAKSDLFLDSEDFSFLLYRCKENLFGRPMPQLDAGRYVRQLLPDGSFTLIAYCLMPNHFHWLLRQNEDVPVNVFVHKICTGYSKYFNKKYERIGHVFQDQFKAVDVVTEEQLLWLSAYIHTNPVVAGLVAHS